MTLADARKQVNEHRTLLDNGARPGRGTPAGGSPPDPRRSRPPTRSRDFVPVFIASRRARRKRGRTRKPPSSCTCPAWGSLPLKEITREHIHERLDALVGKGLTVGVNRIQALISRIFTVALDRGKVDAHPAARIIKRFKEQPRDRVLTDDELRALWAGLDAQPGAASDAVAAAAARAARRRNGRHALERSRPRRGDLDAAGHAHEERSAARRRVATDGARDSHSADAQAG